MGMRKMERNGRLKYVCGEDECSRLDKWTHRKGQKRAETKGSNGWQQIIGGNFINPN